MQDECKISASARLTEMMLDEQTISQYAIHMPNILFQNTFSNSSQTLRISLYKCKTKHTDINKQKNQSWPLQYFIVRLGQAIIMWYNISIGKELYM